MIITVILNKNSASVDFTERVISSSSTAKKYKITIILTCINSRTGFVLMKKQREFHFSSKELLLKQIVKFINQTLYNNADIHDNLIKMILFTQNLQLLITYLLIDKNAEQYLMNITYNKM